MISDMHVIWSCGFIVSEMISQVIRLISEILGEILILPKMFLLVHKFINLKDPGDDLKLDHVRHEPDVLGRDHVPSKGVGYEIKKCHRSLWSASLKLIKDENR